MALVGLWRAWCRDVACCGVAMIRAFVDTARCALWGYGAMAARLTPDQKVGGSSLSGLMPLPHVSMRMQCAAPTVLRLSPRRTRRFSSPGCSDAIPTRARARSAAPTAALAPRGVCRRPLPLRSHSRAGKSTCGLVATTSASRAEGRQFDPGQVYTRAPTMIRCAAPRHTHAMRDCYRLAHPRRCCRAPARSAARRHARFCDFICARAHTPQPRRRHARGRFRAPPARHDSGDGLIVRVIILVRRVRAMCAPRAARVVKATLHPRATTDLRSSEVGLRKRCGRSNFPPAHQRGPCGVRRLRCARVGLLVRTCESIAMWEAHASRVLWTCAYMYVYVYASMHSHTPAPGPPPMCTRRPIVAHSCYCVCVIPRHCALDARGRHMRM